MSGVDAPFSPAAGARVGDWILEERLGQGGFGEVWRARHDVLSREVAIKLPEDAAALEAFRREIVLMDGLEHPGVVAIVSASLSSSPPWLAMEHLPGGNLRERLKSGPIAGDELERIALAVLEALAHAHEAGIVHGDVKPENILFDCEGRPKLGDFGLARGGEGAPAGLELSGNLRSEAVSGTLDYVPREVRDGAAPDARADVYAFGVLLFELATGRRPDVDETPSDLRDDLPAIVDTIFAGCYTRHERRFASAGEILAAWRRATAPEPSDSETARADDTSAEPAVADAPRSEADGWVALAAWSAVGGLVCLMIGRALGAVPAAAFGAVFFGGVGFLSWMTPRR